MHPFFLTVIGAIFILSLVIVKLLLYGRRKLYLNFLLALAITGIVWYALIYLLTNSGYIKNYPELFNKGLPLYYCIAPSLYMYIRGSLNQSYTTFRKVDLWHFIPVIPAFVSIMPYQLLSNSEQQEIVNQVVADIHFAFGNSPYIVGAWHWFLFPAIACGYIFIQFLLAHQASKNDNNSYRIINWIYFFSGLCALIFGGMLLVNITVLRNLNAAGFILQQSSLVLFLCFCLLILSFMFFVHPELIYGFTKHQPETKIIEPYKEINEQERTEKAKIKTVDDELVQRVESFINERQVFRKTGLTLSELASLIDIPNHKLSELFNNYYQLNFNTYINNLRIDHIKKRLAMGDWKQFTLEAIAIDAGFSSRNTFFVAFKKVVGKTPSAYLIDLKDSKS